MHGQSFRVALRSSAALLCSASILQRPKDTPDLLKDPVVSDIAAKHGKNVGQVRSPRHMRPVAVCACMPCKQACCAGAIDLFPNVCIKFVAFVGT